MRAIAFLGLLTCSSLWAAPPWVSCWDDSSQKFQGSKTVRTNPVTSPNGELRAHVEIVAAPVGPAWCANTVKLFLSRHGAPARQVFVKGPSEKDGDAISLGPVAWSPNSRWLAVELGLWAYGSDAGGTALLLYDSVTGAVAIPPIYRLLARGLPHCPTQLVAVLGFNSHGRVKLRIGDYFSEGDDDASSCVGPRTEWLYDPVTRRVSPGKKP